MLLGLFGTYGLLSELQKQSVHKLPDPSVGSPGALQQGQGWILKVFLATGVCGCLPGWGP